MELVQARHSPQLRFRVTTWPRHYHQVTKLNTSLFNRNPAHLCVGRASIDMVQADMDYVALPKIEVRWAIWNSLDADEHGPRLDDEASRANMDM